MDIALYSENGEAVAVSSISKRQNISVKYLEQILAALRQMHLIRGMKGFRGGYVIARPAAEITFQEILNAMDFTILGDTDVGDAGEASLFRETVQTNLWDKMTSYLRSFCANMTLQDMLEQYRGLVSQNETFMYYI